MFLKNIELKNFKCHEHLLLDFTAPASQTKNAVRKTTFLIGENGTGKTALLQAIALVTGGSAALWSVPGLPDAFIRTGQDAAEITATITTAQGEERILSLLLKRGKTLAATVAEARRSLAPMDAALAHTTRSYFTAGYGSARRPDRAGRTVAFPDPRAARYTAVHSLFGQDALLRPLNEWAYESSLSENAESLSAALNTFLPPEVRFSHLAEDGHLLFTTPDGLLPLEALSNGYQQTVAWVGDLLYHVTRIFGDYKNPLSARGLLLIDEIDLHLHPSWQKQIHHFLTTGLPHFQVITTTYSPLTAGSAAAGELYCLQRNARHGVGLQPFTGDSALMLQELRQPLPQPAPPAPPKKVRRARPLNGERRHAA